MLRKLGPIIGVDQERANIWLKRDAHTEFKLSYREKSGKAILLETKSDEEGFALFELSDLKPNTAYNYSIADPSGAEIVKDCRFATLPSEEKKIDFSFGFYSCHKPESDDTAISMKLWEHLADISQDASLPENPNSLRFLLAIGDQIYADEPYSYYLKYTDPEKLKDYFNEKYNQFYDYESIRTVFSNCPAFMIWDDHEIRDDWGSLTTDNRNSLIYKVAEDRYIKYQMAHNPHIRPSGEKYYSFRFGKAGFIVLDLRGDRQRSAGQILGIDQWYWFKTILTQYAENCDIVFVVCSVPFFHIRNQFRHFIEKYLPCEVEDLWNAKHWKQEGLRFAHTVFDCANLPSSKAQIVLLGGDVHVATCGNVFMPDQPRVKSLKQFVSSGISNNSKWVFHIPILSKCIFKKGAKDTLFGKVSTIQGRLTYINPNRNLGIVRLKTTPNGKYDIKYEVHGSNKSGIEIDTPQQFENQDDNIRAKMVFRK